MKVVTIAISLYPRNVVMDTPLHPTDCIRRFTTVGCFLSLLFDSICFRRQRVIAPGTHLMADML